MSEEKRANREEIFSHLRELLGDDAVNVSIRVHKLALEKDYETSLAELKEYDATLGGIGVYKSEGKKMTGIYRAFFYVELPFIAKYPKEDSRDIIEAACGYLEALIKRVRRLSFVETLKDSYKEGLPLGSLLYKVKDILPLHVFDKMIWLNKKVYVFAKHNYDFGDDENEAPEHYFELDEAVAVYFIARVLGKEIEKIGKKTHDELLQYP
jgi:hypothetical protein